MSPLPIVRCAGAPRDLGLDQGRALAARITREAAALHEPGLIERFRYATARRGRVPRVRRDTLRHFPHMGERAMGLARGAGVGTMALAGLLARAFDTDEGFGMAVATAGGTLLGRAIRSPRDALVVRYSTPDSGYRSLEVALAWRVPALLGVNARGLGVMARSGEARPAAGCAAPAILFVQDALQRFDSAEKAAEWLERRPAGGSACFALADAGGASYGVEIEGSARRVWMADPVLPLGAPRVGLVASAPGNPPALARAVLEAEPGALLQVVVAPAVRRLWIFGEGTEPETHTISDDSGESGESAPGRRLPV